MGRVRIGVGAAVVVAGFALLITGAVIDAQPHEDVEADAVATARTGEGGVLHVEAETAGDYTIFVVSRVHGMFEEDGAQVQEDAVHDTRCDVERPGRDVLRLRGDRQGNGEATDDVSSVGWFSTTAGDVRVTCRTESGDDRGVLLVPGKPSIWAGGTVIALIGVAIGVAGFGVAWWGVRARRPATPDRPPLPSDEGWSV